MAEKDDLVSRLVLGTAQLGMPYGIANKIGKPDFSSALSIVQAAWESGISEFDTAQVYGDSESILGRIFTELGIVQKVKVTTKLKPIRAFEDGRTLHQFVSESMERLKLSQLECLLLHREDMLDMLDNDFRESLLTLVQKEYVRYLGVSVYSPKRVKQALEYNIFHAIQIPANIFDRRFHHAGVFEIAKERDCRIYIRSAFLQGLILMSIEDIPEKMESVKPVLAKLDHLALKYRMSRQAIALLYLRDRFADAKVIFGAEVPEQVIENIYCWQLEVPTDFLLELDESFRDLDENILNPAKWNH
ncbi:MAG: aldo/keto reductase [Syntrophaceae bacterium]|nr:aldo/keto reductase [Syntrophaceae bacterium]